jgi:hypothetical protein
MLNSAKEWTIEDGDKLEVCQFEGTVGNFGVEATVTERRTGKPVMFQMTLEEAEELAEHLLWIVSKGQTSIDGD